ncbi:MAG TPA: DUF1833 family protein [Luteimonas sp.]
MRTLTPETAQAILARESEPFLALMQISGTGLETMRVVNNVESITRNGQVYQPWAFDGQPPEDSAQQSPTVTLRVDNIDRAVLNLLRSYTGVPKCELVWVMASQPNQAVYGPFEFVIQAATASELTIDLQLGYEEDILNQAFPGTTYNPTNSPGIYV